MLPAAKTSCCNDAPSYRRFARPSRSVMEDAVNASLSPTLRPSGAQSRASLLQAERNQALLWLLLLGILALRIVGLALSKAELYYDEAQYWAWAQNPAFGYYTKPPLVAWM